MLCYFNFYFQGNCFFYIRCRGKQPELFLEKKMSIVCSWAGFLSVVLGTTASYHLGAFHKCKYACPRHWPTDGKLCWGPATWISIPTDPGAWQSLRTTVGAGLWPGVASLETGQRGWYCQTCPRGNANKQNYNFWTWNKKTGRNQPAVSRKMQRRHFYRSRDQEQIVTSRAGC